MASTTIVALRNTPSNGARRFHCSAATWEFLRDLAQRFGWRPAGATYVTRSRPRTPPLAPVRHNYQPGSGQDYKQVEAEDATEWARALVAAKHSSHFTGLVRAQAESAGSPEEPLLSVLDEFIDFAHEGAFVFALSGERFMTTSTPEMSSDPA